MVNYRNLREKVISIHESDWTERDIINWRDHLRGLAAQGDITREEAESLISMLPQIDLSKYDKEIDSEKYKSYGKKAASAQKAYDELAGGTKIVTDYSKKVRTVAVTQSYDADKTKDYSESYGVKEEKRTSMVSQALGESKEETKTDIYSQKKEEKRVLNCDVIEDCDIGDVDAGVYGTKKKETRSEGPSIVLFDDEDDI